MEVSNLAGIGGDDLAEEERGHADALARAAPDVLGPQHRATAVGHFYEGRSLEVILAGRGESYFPARHRFIRALARVVGRSAHGDRTFRHRGFMAETNQGLTKTYNALKDPANDDPRILALRGLHEGDGSRGARGVRLSRPCGARAAVLPLRGGGQGGARGVRG